MLPCDIASIKMIKACFTSPLVAKLNNWTSALHMNISQADAHMRKRSWARGWNRFPLPQAAYLFCIPAKPNKVIFFLQGSSSKTPG